MSNGISSKNEMAKAVFLLILARNIDTEEYQTALEKNDGEEIGKMISEDADFAVQIAEIAHEVIDEALPPLKKTVN